jgi:hypothetical protein
MPVAPSYLSFLYTEPHYVGKRANLARRWRTLKARTARTRRRTR